jgi:hypothetical protein
VRDLVGSWLEGSRARMARIAIIGQAMRRSGATLFPIDRLGFTE